MLQIIQFQVYNQIITPYIDMAIGSSNVCKALTYCGLSILACGAAAYIGTATVGASFVAGCLTSISTLTLSSCVNEIISGIQTTLESAIEDTIFEKHSEFVKPLINIGLVVLLRQAAAAAVNHLNMTTSSTYVDYSTTAKSNNIFTHVYNVFNNILNFGNITTNNDSNFVSTILEQFAFLKMLETAFNVGNLVFNMITQDSSLSVYDTKQIMSAQSGYKITTAQAKDLYTKFQACEEYYNERNDATKDKIKIIAGMYSRAYGDNQKELMKTSISSELLDKGLKLIDMQIQANVIQKLINAETNLLKIKHLNEQGVIVDHAQKDIIKNKAIITLNAELNALKQLCDISENEAMIYKSFYYKSINAEVELNTLETIWNDLEANHY
jgi:hypothetical protein